MKKTILILFCVIFLSSVLISANRAKAAGTIYYVDNTCSNNGDGSAQTCASSPGATGPFNSIATVNSMTCGFGASQLNAGDSVLSRNGDTFYEQLTVPCSGSSGSPITFGSYVGADSSAVKPIINGADVVSSWSSDTIVGPGFSTVTAAPSDLLDDVSTNRFHDFNDTNPMSYGIDTGPGELWGATRFRNLAVPAGATIISAYITFKAQNSYSDTIALKLVGENTVAPAIFSTYADLNTRRSNLTTATVSWNNFSTTNGELVNTSDVSSIVTEIIGKPGWASGNDISIFLLDNGSATNHKRQFWALSEGETDYAAILTVQYALAPSVSAYSASVAYAPTQLFIGGVRTEMSRWPNTGYSTIDSTSGNYTSLTDSISARTAENYWVGGKMVLKTWPWIIQTFPISASSGNTITWSGNASGYPTEGYGYYIEGTCSEIDVNGEWCYSSSAGKIYLKLGTDPNGHTVEAARRNYGVDVSSKNYVTIQDLKINDTASWGIYGYSATHLTITNTDLNNTSGGVFSDSVGATLVGNVVSNTYEQSGIEERGDGAVLTNNSISNIASSAVSPKSASGIYIVSSGSTISNNSVSNVSRACLYLNPDSGGSSVLSNDLSQCVSSVSDMGALYLDGLTGVLLEGNIIRDVAGTFDGTAGGSGVADNAVGIYADEGANGNNLLRNLIYNVSGYGVLIHAASSNLLYNNTIANGSGVAVYLSEGLDGEMHDNVLKNNIISVSTGNGIIYKRYGANTGVVDTLDFNLYFTPDVLIRYGNSGGMSDYTLSTWKTFSGMDAHSISSDPFFTNTTTNNFTLQSSSPAIDSGADLGATYQLALSPASTWPSGVLTLNQDSNGSGWEIGAYVYPDGAADTTSPTPGSTGTITTASVTSSGLTLNWTKATDVVSAQSALTYRVFKSTSNNIDTVANIFANGTAVAATSTDINTLDVTSLSPATTYYFNVLVVDEAGNTAAYTVKSQATLSNTKAITVFDLNALSPAVVGSVNEGAKTVTLTVPYGTSLTDLVPTITHTGASVNPASGATQTFVDGVAVNYTVTAADSSTQDYVVTVTVAASAGLPTATSVAISGTKTVDQTLTGSYTFTDPNSLPESGTTYAWLRSSTSGGSYSAISGATATTHVLTASDIGQYIKFQVTPQSASGTGSAGLSSATTQIQSSGVPTASSVSISGTVTEGQTLTGNYTYAQADSVAEGATTFRWLSSATSGGTYSAISGATNSTYTVISADQGMYIKFEVTPIASVPPTTGLATLSSATTQVPLSVSTHTITVSSGSNGSISPSGSVSVNDGADQAFTITPSSGYHIDTVTADSVAVSATSPYTFTNVTADHTISATFAADPVPTPAPSSGGGGGGGSSSGRSGGGGGGVTSYQTDDQLRTIIVSLLKQIIELLTKLILKNANIGNQSTVSQNISNQTIATEQPLTTSYVFTRDLSLGMTGNDVKQLQLFLNVHESPVALSGPGSRGEETTYFGPTTRDALTNYQQRHSIADEKGFGYFGKETRERVNNTF